ncbi:CNP1-like family protein [Cupriavidus sp. AU9028]|uniref:CNP1-like family protein n=1 Tax=Cupriavidus sp. AU9028 TaxID=2871157 RepID=UPI001C970F2F|nr:CNP1-like family protein [Cupriavidus sp. AU9028]MBY4897432.1 CNP1-like family protein [Cupriavidus sp. AU9028]
MSFPAGQRRRRLPFAVQPAVTAGLAAIALLTGLSGCSSTPAEPQRVEIQPEEEPVYLLDRLAKKGFQEQATRLPAPPRDSDLLPFDVSSTGRLSFAVDARSLSIGEDDVIRYTVVATSPSGARNVTHEGLRCDSFQRKLFATMPPGRDTWVPNQSQSQDQWRRMGSGVSNDYAATLAVDYFCDGRSPSGKAEDIVRAMKRQTPVTDARHLGR